MTMPQRTEDSAVPTRPGRAPGGRDPARPALSRRDPGRRGRLRRRRRLLRPLGVPDHRTPDRGPRATGRISLGRLLRPTRATHPPGGRRRGGQHAARRRAPPVAARRPAGRRRRPRRRPLALQHPLRARRDRLLRGRRTRRRCCTTGRSRWRSSSTCCGRSCSWSSPDWDGHASRWRSSPSASWSARSSCPWRYDRRSGPWAYYSLPTRAWELAAGGLLALAAPWYRLAAWPAGRRIGWLGVACSSPASRPSMRRRPTRASRPCCRPSAPSPSSRPAPGHGRPGRSRSPGPHFDGSAGSPTRCTSGTGRSSSSVRWRSARGRRRKARAGADLPVRLGLVVVASCRRAHVAVRGGAVPSGPPGARCVVVAGSPWQARWLLTVVVGSTTMGVVAAREVDAVGTRRPGDRRSRADPARGLRTRIRASPIPIDDASAPPMTSAARHVDGPGRRRGAD